MFVVLSPLQWSNHLQDLELIFSHYKSLHRRSCMLYVVCEKLKSVSCCINESYKTNGLWWFSVHFKEYLFGFKINVIFRNAFREDSIVYELTAIKVTVTAAVVLKFTPLATIDSQIITFYLLKRIKWFCVNRDNVHECEMYVNVNIYNNAMCCDSNVNSSQFWCWNLSWELNFNVNRFQFIFGDAVNFQQSYLLLYFQALFNLYVICLVKCSLVVDVMRSNRSQGLSNIFVLFKFSSVIV